MSKSSFKCLWNFRWDDISMKIIEEAKECALNGITLNKEQIIKLLERV